MIVIVKPEQRQMTHMKRKYPLANQCTAKSKRSGVQCKNFSIKGAKTCRMHGGTQPTGMMSHSFKTGRYSQHIPAPLTEMYGRALADENLLSLQDEIALIDTRNSQLLERLNERNSRDMWRRLKAEYSAFSGAVDSDQRKEHVEKILRMVRDGAPDFEIWGEITDNVEVRRRLSESERKRIVDANLSITADRAMGLVVAMVSSFKQNVQKFTPDKQTANRILSATGRDIDALIGQDSRVVIES